MLIGRFTSTDAVVVLMSCSSQVPALARYPPENKITPVDGFLPVFVCPCPSTLVRSPAPDPAPTRHRWLNALVSASSVGGPSVGGRRATAQCGDRRGEASFDGGGRVGQHAYLGYGLLSRRLREPAPNVDQLPPLDAVVLSHMH